MKKYLLLAVAACAMVHSSFAQTPPASGTTFVITPGSQNVNPGGIFNVNISLTGTTPPASIAAYDLYLVTAAVNSGLFTITSSTPTGPFNALGPNLGSGDPLSTAAGAGFVRNNLDLGYSGTAQSPPYSISFQTVGFAVSNSIAPGTYTFFTSTVANSGNFYSDVSDANGVIYSVGQGSFQITVVPEPSTWALAAVGLSIVGFMMFRRSRTA
jgi:PEP-CTERM motif